jgi:hypothetical protein
MTTCANAHATLVELGIVETRELACVQFSKATVASKASVKLHHFCQPNCKPSPYGWYYGQALKFFGDMAQGPLRTRSGAAVLVTQDDATLPPRAVVALRQKGTPLLAHSIQHASAHDAILIPDWTFIQHDGFEQLIRQMRNRSLAAGPLTRRTPRVFWRGSTTGTPCVSLINGGTPLPPPCSPGCFGLQRVKLAQLLANASWADVKISQALDSCGGSAELALRAEGLMTSKVTELGWTKNRAILDIDGHVNAWGLLWRLQSGSVVMRVKSDQINSYIIRLQPKVHYVPIAADLSDAYRVTQQITSHSPTKIEHFVHIVSAARRLAEQFTYPNEVSRVAKELSAVWANQSHRARINPTNSRSRWFGRH